MSSPLTRLLPLLAFLALLLHPTAAFAGKGDDAAAGLLVPIFVAALTFPVGLALHYLIYAYAPRRGAGLVSSYRNHRVKTIVLGIANTIFLLLVALTLKKPAAPLAALAVLLGFALALVGSYGVACTLGSRILDREGPGDVKSIALGWFTAVFAFGIPGLGRLLWLYWAIRGTGAVVLTLFSIPAQPDADPDDAPGDIADLVG
jgi:hypothetical protein